MDSDTVEEISGWETRPYSGGYGGLHDLAREEFTGAVTDGMAWLFMLNGWAVGVADGSLGSFERGDGTAYVAPHPSLPLLFAMRELDGEARAKYYTEDTPLSDVDSTLSSGKFSGYVELSENVLSGDYYIVYHGGRSLACAFVGNSRRVLTGDEAFERADDEVGIYEVHDVDIEVIDIPEPDGESPDATAGEAGSPTDPSGGDPEATTDTPGGDPGSSGNNPPGDDPEATEPAADPAPAESHPGGDSADAGGPDAGAPTGADTRDGDPTESEPPAGGTAPGDGAAAASAGADPDTSVEPAGSGDGESRDTAADAGPGGGGPADTGPGDAIAEEQQWRETRTIPALDPDDVGSGESDPSPEGATDGASEPPPAGGVDHDEVSDLRERLSEARQAREEAEAARDRLAADVEQLEAERDEYRAEAQRLEDRVADLESEVERLEAALADAGSGADPDPERTIEPQQALEGTNLFVRYDSKSGATLESAHAGGADRDEVVDNLRLDHHASFDTEGLHVAGRPYEEFLRTQIEYGFVHWVVNDLLYEIRDTGNVPGLQQLFDVLPDIDRAELYGAVSLQYQEDGEQHREQQTFDVVLRDRMGNPLVIANFNDSRDPATADMMTSLVQNARRVTETGDTLGGAFLVTASYFQPAALETAADATGGGLLSRGSLESFVRVDRKRGFHLCLVETRSGNFHLNVPEL